MYRKAVLRVISFSKNTEFFKNTPYSINVIRSNSHIRLARNYCSMDSSYPTNLTMQELTEMLSSKMGVTPGYKTVPPNRSHLIKYLPKSQSELEPRSMADSFLTSLIPLSTDLNLREKYVTFLGHVRVGRLLEDMDIFAVLVAHKHILNRKLPNDVPSPHILVTGLVDEIHFTNYTPIGHEDIKISGHVSWVGKTSMEVVVWLEQKTQKEWNRITRALFVIVARDPTNTGPAIVNSIKPANDRETKILSGGEMRKQKRSLKSKQHVARLIPTESEQKLLHQLFTENFDLYAKSDKKLPSGSEWMENCMISNILLAHPENRNIHNTVFGGFIMRQAAELSWILSYMFSKYRLRLKCISDINFSKPIAVNSLIKMYAHVVHTHLNFLQILVLVESFNPTTGKSDTTNSFHFTYEGPEMLKQVVPNTYREAMMYIDGMRHFTEVMNNSNETFLDVDEVKNTTSKL